MLNINIKKLDGIWMDVESNGLVPDQSDPVKYWAAHAVLYVGGMPVEEFTGREAGYVPTNEWVRENAYPHNADIMEVSDLHAAFTAWYLEHKDAAGGRVWAHMGAPVESGFFAELVHRKHISMFEGPYPLLDVSGLLLCAGLDPTSVDDAADMLGVRPAGNSHDCRYDVRAMRAVAEALITP